ncbi:3-deoxy-manno-octulosonate cytidylyltransferase [Pseudomaricurvus alkylphenolicus]|jgi:3-deoxy-manno-octulosonate cytidylyltransferase (CMP-KDO synthetase)|uniref:3-deoxy-manno-octulosonate cytidylyltransferase n=1 Tax=Pseudomaricurvus alkylphenolicus TaxID=1306991 RepID=UPI0014223C36|nr:3-deoxy-manno-octulosonate cytidylyltransferase [Pseudomaricurvus alkylphenolicus]NIB41248.1 3-deoxy-manno-octulosonate cytidylyltransferase [Pseudomaricurvus alkylphenolicus]
MNYTVVIPARYASTRLPGKPLKDIAGKTMVQRVYEQATQSGADRVVIATDDQRIEQQVRSFGAEVCMTSDRHESGTDRLQEVAQQLALADDDIVVNVQGDEPLIPPAVIDQVAANLAANADASVATLSEPIEDAEDYLNPNIVKVVADKSGLALYFSRASIPWPRDSFAGMDLENPPQLPAANLFQRHIGIYAYRVRLLNEFVTWPQAPLETLECLEQLRVLWNGQRIHVAEAQEKVPGGVDTQEDLDRVCRLLS